MEINYDDIISSIVDTALRVIPLLTPDMSLNMAAVGQAVLDQTSKAKVIASDQDDATLDDLNAKIAAALQTYHAAREEEARLAAEETTAAPPLG